MPALKMFSRRLHIGSDDLEIPGVLSALSCLVMCALLLVHFLSPGSDDADDDSGARTSLTRYALGSSVFCVVALVCDIGLIVYARQGHVTEDVRRCVPYVLTARVALFAPMAAVIGWGMWALVNRFEDGVGKFSRGDCALVILLAVQWVGLVSSLCCGTAVVGRKLEEGEVYFGWGPTEGAFPSYALGYHIVRDAGTLHCDDDGPAEKSTPWTRSEGSAGSVESAANGACRRRRPTAHAPPPASPPASSALTSATSAGPYQALQRSTAETIWSDRCARFCRATRCLTCNAFGGKSIGGTDMSHFEVIARVLADYFEDEGHLDVVPGDILAGMALLRVQQKAAIEREEAGSDGPLKLCTPSYESVSPDAGDNRKKMTSQGIESIAAFAAATTTLGTNIPDINISSNPGSPLLSHTEKNDNKSSHLCSSFGGPNKSTLDASDTHDAQVLRDGARGSRHALGIYTWMLYIYMRPCTGMARLLTCPSCFCCTASKPETFEGENICSLHSRALVKHVGLAQSDIVYASFRSGLDKLPYAIVIDHSWKALVISIRGTLSLEDLVMDVVLDPASLAELGETYGFPGTDQYVHRGILLCVKWLKDDLDKHNLLTEQLQKYPSYNLNICGHSLGAGAAILLSYMLRPVVPSLRCYAYAPPGGFLTRVLAEDCAAFTSTFVLHTDLVPRLSVRSMEQLRDSILNLLSRARTGKHRIIATLAVAERPGADTFRALEHELMWQEEEAPETEFRRSIREFREVQNRLIMERSFVMNNVDLFLAGKVVHLQKAREQREGCLEMCPWRGREKPPYTPVHAGVDGFSEIIISRTLWLDHFPNRICLYLEEVATKRGVDLNFRETLPTFDSVAAESNV